MGRVLYIQVLQIFKNNGQVHNVAALCQNERKRNDVEVSGLVYHTHTDLVFVQNCNLLLAVA